MKEISFKVTEFYNLGDKGRFIWNDTGSGIKWTTSEEMNLIIGKRNRNLKRLIDSLIP